MSKFTKSFLLIASILLMGALLACDWDDLDKSDDPDHPLYVSYTISVGQTAFDGPEQLLADINAWVKANQIMFDRQVNYSTGDPSEFTKTDAEAIKKYEEFVPKFKSYLEDVKRRVADGFYTTAEQPDVTVHARFYTFAARVQGTGNNLKSETFELNWPE